MTNPSHGITAPEGQQLLATVIEASPTGMLLVETGGPIVMANPQIERIVGYARGELIGRPLDILLPEQSRSAHHDHLSRFHADPHPRHMGAGRELYARHKDGRAIPVEIGLAPVRHGAKHYVLASLIDITNRRHAEEAVRASEAYHRNILENIGDAVFIADAEGRYVDVNPRACELTGYTREELLRLGVIDTYPPESRGEAVERISHVAGGRPVVVERPLVRQDGRIIAVEANARPLSGGRMLVTVRDVTERHQLERQLRQAQKMEAVGRLAGGVAHDFNNLLTAIFGYTDLLAEDLAPDHPGRADLQEIQTAATRASALTRQLLAFSRQQVLQPVVLNLNDVVADVQKMLKRLLGEDVELHAQLAPDLGNVRADAGQVEQVIMNLAVNARDAMPTGGQLTIETANVELTEDYAEAHPPVMPGRFVMLAVSDTGVGMDEATRAKVFEPFFTTKEPGKGTGLGLATVYGIVKQSGGFIWVYSEPGKGAAFKAYFPRVDAPIEPGARAPEVAGTVAGTETILLAEDDELLRPLARELLTKLGYAVLEARGSAEALTLARGHEGEIHLLVSDVVMPGGGGFHLAQQLLAERPNLRVLYMSGYTDEAVVRHGLLERGLNYLQKPFTPAVLARRVRDVLDGK